MRPVLTEVVLICPACGDSTLAFVDLKSDKIQYCHYRSSCENYLRMMAWDANYYTEVDDSEESVVEETAEEKETNQVGDNRLSYRLDERVGQTYQTL